jgi:hypothetical protein
MASFSKQFLSGSTNGRPIGLTQTATAGDTIHTATSTSGEFDEVWLYFYNRNASAIVITIEFGGVTAADTRTISLNSDTRTLVVSEQVIAGGLTVAAFAASNPTDISVAGWVNRISA